MPEEITKRTWTAWAAIIPLGALWVFCLFLPASMLRLAYALFHGGLVSGGAAVLLLALPAAWPLARCSRAIRDYYTGRETFKLNVSGRDLWTLLFLLALLSFLVYNAVNYADWAGEKAAAARQRTK